MWGGWFAQDWDYVDLAAVDLLDSAGCALLLSQSRGIGTAPGIVT